MNFWWKFTKIPFSSNVGETYKNFILQAFTSENSKRFKFPKKHNKKIDKEKKIY